MASVYDVANFILQSMDGTTAWQLQKLCYYTKAWGLAIEGNPVFGEPFEAWANGPVCRALYYKHKGRKSIPKDYFSKYVNMKDEEKALVKAVLRKYGSMTGEELRNLSNSETPWKETRGDLPEDQNCDRKIEDDLMRSFYAMDKDALEEMDDFALTYLADIRLSKGGKTVSFQDMMQRYGIGAEDLDGEDVEFEIEPIIL